MLQKQIGPAQKKHTMEVMQVSYTNRLEGGRRHHSIGRVKASSGWRAVRQLPAVEADRLAAVRALIREAEEYERRRRLSVSIS